MSEKKVILTDEQRKELLGMMPIAPNASVQVVCDVHKELSDDVRPAFRIRGLTQGEWERIAAKENIDVVAECVVGWERLFDLSTGEAIEYDASRRAEIIDTLPRMVYNELAKMIWRASGILEQEKRSLE